MNNKTPRKNRGVFYVSLYTQQKTRNKSVHFLCWLAHRGLVNTRQWICRDGPRLHTGNAESPYANFIGNPSDTGAAKLAPYSALQVGGLSPLIF